jgi:hypothetical protein
VGIPTVVDFPDSDDPCRRVATGDWVRLDGANGTLTILKHSQK